MLVVVHFLSSFFSIARDIYVQLYRKKEERKEPRKRTSSEAEVVESLEERCTIFFFLFVCV